MAHFWDDVVLYLIQQNALMQYSNNRYVFICNNRNALFQYHPTLLDTFLLDTRSLCTQIDLTIQAFICKLTLYCLQQFLKLYITKRTIIVQVVDTYYLYLFISNFEHKYWPFTYVQYLAFLC